MAGNKEKYKKIINGRLLKNYGSWMYCNSCNKTVGYLCYTTYEYFYFNFTCKCGNKGSFELGQKPESYKVTTDKLVAVKNRMCCPKDKAPLFSVVDKNVDNFSYEVICNKCTSFYRL